MTNSAQWYLDVSGKIFQGIGARTNQALGDFIEKIEGLDGPDIGFIQIGSAFSPDPLTVAGYVERGPYAHPKIYSRQLDAAVERGWLKKIGDGAYQVSSLGMETVDSFLEMGNKLFGDLPALPKDKTEIIADLLARLVDAAYQQDEPTPTMEIGIRLIPGKAAPAIVRIRRQLTDLAYYREDVHSAAWKNFYQVDGRVFETLTQMWQGDETVHTPAELAERLAEYRGYAEADYAAAYEELVSLGWAGLDDGKYSLTEEGRRIRQEAEDRTDEYFAKPFEILTLEERAELETLMEKLAEVMAVPDEETVTEEA